MGGEVFMKKIILMVLPLLLLFGCFGPEDIIVTKRITITPKPQILKCPTPLRYSREIGIAMT
jgi:hypothetical protein